MADAGAMEKSGGAVKSLLEIEEYYQTLAAEVDSRIVKLVSTPCRLNEDSPEPVDHQTLLAQNQACVEESQRSWASLLEASHCMRIHLENAARYQQFCHEAAHCEAGLKQLTSWCRNHTPTSDNAQAVSSHIKETLQHLLAYQVKVDVLYAHCDTIIPVPLRRRPVDIPLKVKALVNYDDQQVKLSKDEECLLLDNSEITKWKVRTSSGEEVMLPAMIFLVPAPDGEAIRTAQRVRQQLLATWSDCVSLVKRQGRKFFMNYFNKKDSKEVTCLSEQQRADVLKCLDDMSTMLASSPQMAAPAIQQFLAEVQQWHDQGASRKPPRKDQKGKAPAVQDAWQHNAKLVQHVQEFETYMKSYKDDIDATCRKHQHLIEETDSDLKYVSSAYIEKLKPVEIKHKVPDDEELSGHVTLAEKSPSKRRPETETESVETETVTRSLSNDFYSSQTIKQTQTFVIVGVIDPRSDENISIYRAITDGVISRAHGLYCNPDTGDSMPIPEAMNRGLIKVEYTDTSIEMGELVTQGIIRATTSTEIVSYLVHKVVDPVTGDLISILEAVQRGIIDLALGQYHNTVTDERLSIPDAIEQGLLQVEIADRQPRADLEDDTDGRPGVVVTGVMNPKTGKHVNLPDAIKLGIIDMENGTYRDPITGETMPITMAISRGFIKVRPADPEKDRNSIHVIPGHMIGDLEIEPVQSEISGAIYEKLKNKLDLQQKGIYEQASSEELTIEEAFEGGILGFDPLCIANIEGEKYSLPEASVLGLIEPTTMASILETVEPYCLQRLIDSKELNPATGKYRDPRLRRLMPLDEAIEAERVDSDLVFFTHVPSHTVMSLSSAVNNHQWNPKTGMLMEAGEEMTLEHAINLGIVDPEIDSMKAVAQAASLKFLKTFLDTDEKQVSLPWKDKAVSLDNAILSGAFDIGRTCFVNATDRRVFSLPEAVDMELIDQETAKNIYEVLSSCSLSAVIADGCINPNTGKYIDEETNAKMSMLEAIERGCLDPTCVFLVDNATHKVKSLQAFIEDGQFNPTSGKFVDPNTNEEVTITRAIEQGIIAADFSTNDFIKEKCTLADLINSAKLNTAKALFDAPNGQEMSLKESLANGFLMLNSVVQVEPLTGHVVLAGDGDTVKALIDTKNNLDWVGEVETSLAQQIAPSSSQNDIQLRLVKCQDIQATVDDHKAVVIGTVEHAQQLLDNNREVTRDTGEEQQYQRLRFNTSDLKVRFEGVNNQLDSRKTLLDGMMAGLDTYKDKLNTFSLWTDDAQAQINKMKQKVALSDDLDSVKQQLQDFSEHAMAQEDTLQAIAKTGHQVLDEAQKFKKEKKAFSRNIQSKDEVSSSSDEDEVNDSSLIEGEIQEADNKLKTVLAECTDFMAKLTDTASKNKQYNSLKSKLTQWLPEMADRVDQCINTIAPGEDPKNHLDELKAITTDVVTEGKLIEDIHKVGQDLVDILEELNCKDSPKAIEIQQTVADLQNQYDAIQQALANKQQNVNAIVVQSQDAEYNLQAMFDWVNETQGLFDNMMPVSLDKDVLNEQMRMHRVIASEIENHKMQVDSVSEQCEAYPATQGQVAQLWDAFDELVSRSEERGEDLDSVVHKLATLHGNVNQLESWIANTVRSLKRESSEFDHGSMKDKIENLYRQKQKKQGDLDNIKVTGKDLIDNPNTSDKNRLRQTLASIQGNWHDLTELLVQMISFTALREIDDLLKYLDRAENEINTAEPISTDPEILTVQLRDHKVFHEDLESKRDTVNQTIDKCNKMLRETTNAEADDIKNKLNTIRNQADLVCRLSNERLMLLEEALPLTSHFSETHADLQSWLGEIEAEIASLEVPDDSAAEQIRKQQDNAKMTQRIIEDHKPLVEDLNITGQELMEICTDEDASDIKEDVDNIIAKYDDVKVGVRDKLTQLESTLRTVSTELSDSLESLVEELHYLSDQVQYADPIAANPDALREQMADNNTIVGDLERRIPAIKSTKTAAAEELQNETPENRDECEDLRCRLQDIDSLHDSIQQQTQERARQLEEAVSVADAFHATYKDVMRALQDIQDNLMSQDSPGIDAATIGEQQKELEAIQSELSDLHVAGVLDECQRQSNELTLLAGTPGKVEVTKYMEDLDSILEEIEDAMKDREEELETALSKAHKYDQTLQSIAVWLPTSETKLQNMSPVATDSRAVRIQLEELKVLKLQVHGHYGDIQNLNQYASDLKHASPVTAESLNPQVQEINERWGGLEAGLHQRERDLNETLVRLGEIDQALDDMNGFLQQTECDLQELDDIYGDPKFIETHLKNLQLVQNDLANQEPMVTYLNEAVTELVERGSGPSSSWREKQSEMNELYESVCIMARDKQNRLQDTLKEVKAFAGDVEDLLRWLNNFRGELKTSEPMGALPDTAQHQFNKFLGSYRALEQKEDEVKALLLNGEDMLARCRERDTEQLREDLGRLRTRMYDTRSKADRRKGKLEEHLANVLDFHAMLKIHTDWLNNAEKILGSFKYPSKIVDRILKQIQDHQDFKQDIDAHRDLMYNLDRTGTYLKYFGRKQDTVYIKNLLISIKLRWKKLVRRAGEKGRMLQQAYKEDKRFYDTWRGLCDWLEDGERRLKKYATATPGKVRHDLDELQHFQNELTTRHPMYYSTMRLGRNLKDRCTKSDPEQGMLINMLEELKNKWNILRSIVAQRQNKLDEALLSSGRITDALQSLLEWLSRAEVYLAEDQPVLGDLDTVSILIEQQKVFQQELDSRQSMVAAMRSSPTNDPTVATQLDELTSVWDRVNQLSQVREARLQEALKLAEDFNETVQVVREWLPQVEAELKFRSLPDNEDAIVQRIEQHDKLHGDLQQQQGNIERIKYLAQEILMACHPNAVRFVKYYLTITQTRWEQAILRASQRSQRLQEALRNVRGNAVLLDELLAWLTEAQALLHTKTKDTIPEDLTVVEALVREHLEFHEDLTCKNKDVERVTKLPISAEGSKHLAAIRGSQWKLNESDTPNPRVNILQNRWRSVWRMSVERKKKLQDSLDHLLELESFKNFDFDMWRQRYMAWIRAKKLRITDFFRRQDKDGDGSLSRHEFVEGMLASKFPTNRTELNAVFNVFDRDGSGSLDYHEFVNALKPDRQRHMRARPGKQPPTDGELIHDEIENQVSACQCRHQFCIQKMGEGKYKFGEKQKICLVRFLNHTVMVRVGGGWMTLAEFLENNDPCKAKGRTNTELREQFVLPEGSSPGRATFTPRRGGGQANGSHYSSNSVSPAESSGSLHSSPSHQPAGTKPSTTSTPRTGRGSTGPTTSTPRPSSRPKTTPGRTQNNGTPAPATPRSNKGGLRSAGSATGVRTKKVNSASATKSMPPPRNMRF